MDDILSFLPKLPKIQCNLFGEMIAFFGTIGPFFEGDWFMKPHAMPEFLPPTDKSDPSIRAYVGRYVSKKLYNPFELYDYPIKKKSTGEVYELNDGSFVIFVHKEMILWFKLDDGKELPFENGIIQGLTTTMYVCVNPSKFYGWNWTGAYDIIDDSKCGSEITWRRPNYWSDDRGIRSIHTYIGKKYISVGFGLSCKNVNTCSITEKSPKTWFVGWEFSYCSDRGVWFIDNDGKNYKIQTSHGRDVVDRGIEIECSTGHCDERQILWKCCAKETDTDLIEVSRFGKRTEHTCGVLEAVEEYSLSNMGEKMRVRYPDGTCDPIFRFNWIAAVVSFQTPFEA